MKFGVVAFPAAALALVLNCSAAPAFALEGDTKSAVVKKEPRGPSRYLQCDGQPNNTTAGESAARLIGALTLLGLFAPAPEFPDPQARKFGADGVAVCSSLLNGTENVEGNPVRRLELLLARALHQIEAKNYDAAIADIQLARNEADAKGFSSDVYFARSMGLSFDLIEAEALIRLNKIGEARDLGLRKVKDYPSSYYPLIASRPYTVFNREISVLEQERMDRLERISINQLRRSADRYDEVGQFALAARKREAFIEYVDLLNSEDKISVIYAEAAMSHALANDWAKAQQRADFARTNLENLTKQGRGDASAPSVIEILDLYDIVKNAHEGKIKDARRSFAARSRWFQPSLGQVMETNRRLRANASKEEIFGSLEKSADQIWADRRDEGIATMIENDKNNKTLFSFKLPFASANSFESLSGHVWKVKKSSVMSKAPHSKTKEWTMYLNSDAMTSVDALMLHAALQAKERGLKTFNFSMIETTPNGGSARFTSASGDKIVDELALDTDAVINELKQIIPDPETLKAMKAKRIDKK